MKIGIIGAGRIGKVHARNITRFVPQLQIKAMADPFMNADMETFAKDLAIPYTCKDPQDLFQDPEIQAVLICSSTNTHADLIHQAAAAGKHIFCEKPIDYDISRVRSAIAAADQAGVKLQIGFCRRFDHNHRAVYDMVRAGKVGQVHLVKISSRDPEPPSIAYVKSSGGIFCDMMIHDFDMARFLAGSEVTEVSACGAVLVDPAIGEAGDVDTAVVTLRFENGAIGVIDNSRQAVYGYDQRVEVFGSRGCAMDGNDTPTTATLWNQDGCSADTTYHVMWDRYTGAFVSEMQAFADAVTHDRQPLVTGMDGLYPVLMAVAVDRSLREHRPVAISEVE